MTMKQVRAAQNNIHLNGHRVDGDQVSNQRQWQDGPRQSLGEDRSSQGYTEHFSSSASGASLARKDLKTREAVNRDRKIKQEDQEIEERVEFNGESQSSESRSKRSLLSFLKHDDGGSNSQQSASQSNLKACDEATNEITEEDFDVNNLEGS